MLDLLAVYIVPLYNELKLGFMLFLGVFGGAGMIYPFLEPFLLQAEKVEQKYEAMLKTEFKKAMNDRKKK